MRKQIITSNFWWLFAADLVKLFHDKGFHSDHRDYSETTIECIESFDDVTPRPLAGCTKLHMIVFNIDGSVQVKQNICDCEMCFSGEFDKCKYNDPEDVHSEEAREEEDAEDEDDIGNGEDDDYEDDEAERNARFEMMCELIQPGQVIALRTPPEEKESFYLVAVNEIVKNSHVKLSMPTITI